MNISIIGPKAFCVARISFFRSASTGRRDTKISPGHMGFWEAKGRRGAFLPGYAICFALNPWYWFIEMPPASAISQMLKNQISRFP
jgi:hypothetical protein